MLRVQGRAGSFEVSPETEARLKAMTDNELCVKLNAGSENSELIAEAYKRGTIQFTDAYGFMPIK